jgi:hypothetical protein
MLKFVIPALAAGMLLGTAAVSPSSAAPVGTMSVAAPESIVDTVAYRRQHRMHRRHMMRSRMMKRRMMRRSMMRQGMGSMYRPSQAGNARNPERPVYQQNQGNTTGGYRR